MIEWSMLTSQNECRRVVQDMSKAKQCSSGRRSKGSKSEPCCASCGSTGHYSSSCPTLAAKLLSAVTRTHGTRQVKEFLKSQKPAKLLGCEHKKKKTLKRASGKRFFQRNAVSSSDAKKAQPDKKRKRIRAGKEARRTPRAQKNVEKQSRISEREVNRAYRYLKDNKFCWKPGLCECGGQWEQLSHRHNQCRGRGRKFFRCLDCQTYRDVLVFSHLPPLRMTLPAVAAALKAIVICKH